MNFTATIRINGINPYVWVSASRAQQLQRGWKKPMPVLVQVNGEPEVPWRINMMPAGDGGFYLYLSGVVRKASGTQVGDRVSVTVAFDDSYANGPQHAMPDDLAARLDANAVAMTAWNALTPSRQKEILRYLASLKSETTKQRNIERVMRVLGGAKERFMARDWNSESP